MANILLGVSGGIAAYKAAYLLRLLQKDNHNVKVVMTAAAEKFVGKLTFEALSGHPVYTDSFPVSPISHIDMAKWADMFIIAPATANTIAKIAHGIADNLLTSAALAFDKKLIICPAMNNKMYLNKATEDNIALLKSRGVNFIEPVSGNLACGDEAVGKLEEPENIVKALDRYLCKKLSGLKILVTAGPTVEEIDPVRFISNYSSGKMGYAIAEKAAENGAEVALISGPVSLFPPVANVINVKSAEQMLSAVKKRVDWCDILIMAAAVADYRPEIRHNQKIKKTADNKTMSLLLVRNCDILKDISAYKRKDQIFIGFAAESQDISKNALIKLNEKGLDAIAANDISREDIGFNSDDNEITIFFKDKENIKLSKRSKEEIASELLDTAAELFRSKK